MRVARIEMEVTRRWDWWDEMTCCRCWLRGRWGEREQGWVDIVPSHRRELYWTMTRELGIRMCYLRRRHVCERILRVRRRRERQPRSPVGVGADENDVLCVRLPPPDLAMMRVVAPWS
jgi:hypothetical protein